MAEADDREHLEFATAQGWALVSHDRDFWTLHAEWLSQGLYHTGIILFDRRFQGNIGKIVTKLYDLYELILEGAGNLEEDIHNHIYEFDW